MSDEGEQSYCFAGGLVVGTRHEIPDDPRICRRERSQLIGCNQLICTDCKSTVKHLDGVYLTGAGYEHRDPQKLYDSNDPRSWEPFVAIGAQFRTYFCRCSCISQAGLNNASYLDSRNIDGWTCGGHPK